MSELEIPPLDETTIRSMVSAFYRQVRTDELLAPMYPENDWEGAEQRLRDFLIYRFGGSDQYLRDRGHPRLGMRHAPFKIGAAERDRWLQLMETAMSEIQLQEPEFEQVKSFFQHVAHFLTRH